MTTGINVAPDPFAVITAGLNVAGAVVNLTAQQLAFLNSPQEIQARLNIHVQEMKDGNVSAVDAALKTGNTSTVDKNLS